MSVDGHDINNQKKQFLNIYADFYEDYGLPGVCGWIDGLLYLESTDKGESWTQLSISLKLKDLFSTESKYPISVSSINRFIKICEQYGTIEKRGSHKLGYTYHSVKGNELLFNIFKFFMDRNEIIIERFDNLHSTDLEDNIQQAVQEQIIGLQFYNEMLKQALKWGIEQLQEWNQGDE